MALQTRNLMKPIRKIFYHFIIILYIRAVYDVSEKGHQKVNGPAQMLWLFKEYL